MVLKELVTQYYKNLYTVEACTTMDVSAWNFPILSHADRSWLNCLVLPAKVKRAVFQIGPDKAPGSDGFPLSFFKKYRGAVGESVVEFVEIAF